MSEFLTIRDGWWHFVRRVPAMLVDRDKRTLVRQSTKVRVADDPRGVRAQRVADRLNESLEGYWRDLASAPQREAQARYDAARRTARLMGFDYAPVQDLARRTDLEILKRLDRLVATNNLENPQATAALLGGEQPPTIKLSGLYEVFEALHRAGNADMSPNQRKKWGQPKSRAISNLIKVTSDKPIAELTRADALDFQEWWHKRLLIEGLDIVSANKDIGHLNKMLKVVNERHRLGLSDVFGQLRIEGAQERSRPPFEADFVQTRLLADGAFAAINEEARRVIYLVAETGIRLSEAVNLGPGTIHLDCDVPYVSVRAAGRRMKTRQSERDIPLVGVALAAMLAQPHGFPRYHDKAASLSAAVNKFLEENALRPTERHSLYSLRHTFEDRLTAVEAPEKLIAALMGHKYARPKYGAGPSLEQKREWLQRIAFNPPATV